MTLSDARKHRRSSEEDEQELTTPAVLDCYNHILIAADQSGPNIFFLFAGEEVAVVQKYSATNGKL